jgi:uncharacterized protein (DUF362 family)
MATNDPVEHPGPNTATEYVRDTAVDRYCLDSPFDPPEPYPEFEGGAPVNARNRVYGLVRDLLRQMRLDEANIDRPEWNPLGDVIRPGDRVVIKPNWVTHTHYLGNDHLYSTIVHGSVLRPLVDYVKLALGDTGEIVIADNPVEGADFEKIMAFTGARSMVDTLKQRGYRQLSVADLRPRALRERKNGEFYYETQAGDPLGYTTIDLGKDSLFAEFDDRDDNHYYTLADPAVDHFDPTFRGKSRTDDYHNATTHKYVVSRTLLNADVILNVAKMKCHCKSGVSLNLKNMIGVVYEKHCMPHHRPGMFPEGDSFSEYPATHYVMARKAYVKLRKWIHIHRFPGFRRFRNTLQKNKVLVGQHIEHGNWKGNDTIWRTILDLNRILLYGDVDGYMHDRPQRKLICVTDGIISQQADAPINGEAIATSVLVGGLNPVLNDALALKLMGIDYRKIKAVAKAPSIDKWPLLADPTIDLGFSVRQTDDLKFELSRGWK